MWEFLQGYGIWVALGVAVLAVLLIHALPGHHPCAFRDVAEEMKRHSGEQKALKGEAASTLAMASNRTMVP